MSTILSKIRSHDKEINGVRLIIGYLGAIVIFSGVIILLPLLSLLAYPSETEFAGGFLLAGGIALVLGAAMFLLIHRKPRGRLGNHHDAFIVTFAWVFAVVLCALPYIIDRELNFTEAVFESVSMWTTSGMSVSDVDTLPNIFLFYRSIMQFFGGVGLILVALSFFSDARLSKILNTEGHADKLLPNFKKTARTIFTIYSGYAFLGMVLYKILGMSWFEAINYSLCAISTGGGVCTSGGIAAFNSIGIEVVTICLMIFGGTSFLVHLYLLRRKLRAVGKSSELRLFFGYVIFMVLVCTALTGNFRISLFQSVSAITSTGLQTVDTFVGIMPAFFFLLMLMMAIGGQSGSTSGGIKMNRLYIALGDIWWSIRRKLVSPRVVRVNKWNKLGVSVVISNEERTDTYSFIILYITVFFIVTFIAAAAGYSMEDAAFFTASCMGNCGLVAGVVPATAPMGILWTGTIAMLLGRLEIYIILLSFFPIIKGTQQVFSRKKEESGE